MDAKLKTKNSKLVALLLDWFSAHARDLPWRRTHDPYGIWVSEIMLQQTQVKTVIPYWERWLRELPTIQAAANVSPAKLHKLWEGLGYYTRVRNLQKAAQQIVAQHNGDFPKAFAEILALPGIGRYTAGAICSIAFNQPTPILDGNVIRVLTRIFGIATDPREKQTNAQLWQLAEALVKTAAGHEDVATNQHRPKPPPLLGERAGLRGMPASKHQHACSHLNQSLMELGALICTPRSPQCSACPVNKLCLAFRDQRQDELPNLGKRAAPTARHFIAFIAEHRGKFLVRQRPTGVVNAHLWEFPNVEVNGDNKSLSQHCESVLGVTPDAFEKICTIKHSITRYRITLEAHRLQLKARPKRLFGVWHNPAKFEDLAFTSAHKKILSNLTLLGTADSELRSGSACNSPSPRGRGPG